MNPDDMGLVQGAQALGAALGVGLMVGLERGWRDRDLPEGGRLLTVEEFTGEMRRRFPREAGEKPREKKP